MNFAKERDIVRKVQRSDVENVISLPREDILTQKSLLTSARATRVEHKSFQHLVVETA